MFKVNLRFGLVAILSMIPLNARAQGWSTQFGPPPSGMGLNSAGYALLVYNDRLVAAGDFTQAGTVGANRIAAWDGSSWAALGSGVSTGPVLALTEYNGDLIAAGGTGSSGGGFLKRWNGSTWASMLPPPGNTPEFTSAFAFNDLLFVNSYEDNITKLAWWNGVNWATTSLPPDAVLTATNILGMTSFGGQLYVAGYAFKPGSVPGFPAAEGGFLFSWDGNGFGGPGYVFNRGAYCLHVDHQRLCVGGEWSAQPPIGTDAIALWDGSDWNPFASPLGFVYGMETYHGRLITGGDAGVSSWTGTTETRLGSVDYYVSALREYHGDLYAAGTFSVVSAGWGLDTPSYNIARWSEPTTGVKSITDSELSLRSAPNPFNPSVTLSINVPAKGNLTISISDATGRVVRHLFNGVRGAGSHQVSWNGMDDNGEALASGVYFARVLSGGSTATTKLVLLK
jgi:hypothetical protein